MTSDLHASAELSKERETIARLGRLHWLHWAVVGLSLIVTVGAWYYVKQQHDEKTRTKFQSAAEQILELASERMQKYEDGLWGGVAAIQAQGGDITHEDWRQFAQSLHIENKYPGINGIGVIHQVLPDSLENYLVEQRSSRPGYHIHPEHDEPINFPITYIEPSDENIQAIGLDMAHEPNRYKATLQARDTGKAQITGPIVLVQDATRTPGFLFYAPFYSGGVYQSLEERQEHFTGMVYAPFVFHKLMNGVLGKSKRQVRIRVLDGSQVLYDEHSEADEAYDPDPLAQSNFSLDLYGRSWTFDIRSTKAFREASANSQPTMILLGGITIDSLLLTLFILLSRANRRAVFFADRVADQLHRSSVDRVRLTEDNARKEQRLLEERAEANALEISLRKEREKGALQRKFVAMVSHEFRTPLAIIDSRAHRALRKLDTLSSEAMAEQLQGIRSQVTRVTGLIEQMLASARLEAGTVEFKPASFNLRELIDDACSQQDEISPNHAIDLELCDVPEDFVGDQKMLRQIFVNLLSNAVKYSPDGKRVKVRGVCVDQRLRFDITDYGLGVPEAELPELFTHCFRASTSEGIAGTGIGLYLVKSFADFHEGELHVQSSVGQGSTFTLWLPLGSRDASATPYGAAA